MCVCVCVCVCVCYSGPVLFVCSKVCHLSVVLLCVMSVYLSVFVSEVLHTFSLTPINLEMYHCAVTPGGPNHQQPFPDVCEALEYQSQSMIKYSVYSSFHGY